MFKKYWKYIRLDFDIPQTFMGNFILYGFLFILLVIQQMYYFFSDFLFFVMLAIFVLRQSTYTLYVLSKHKHIFINERRKTFLIHQIAGLVLIVIVLRIVDLIYDLIL